MKGTYRRPALPPLPWLVLAGSVLTPLPGADGISLLGLPPLCAFRWVTGIGCPGCGMLRSLVCCGHGDLARAIAFHPIGPLVFLGTIGWVGFIGYAKRHPNWRPSRAQRNWFHRTCWAALIATLVLWPLRLLGWIPSAP